MIFSLSIECPFSKYTIEYKNKEFHINFKEKVVENVLKKFIDEFLINFDYKKNLNNKIFYKDKTNDQRISKYGCEIYADELRYSRISKIVNRQRNTKRKLKASKKPNYLIQLDSSTCMKFVDKICDTNLMVKKLKHSDLELRMNKSLKQMKETNLTRTKNKRCQTKIKSLINEEKSLNKAVEFNELISGKKLKPNWICQKNSMGIEFYVNFQIGYTTYDPEEAFEELQQTKEEINSFTDFTMKFSNLNIMKCFADDLKPRSKQERELTSSKPTSLIENDKISMNKILLEKNILVKWRNKEEFLELSKNLQDFNNFDNFGSKIIDKNIFKKLTVIGQLDKKFIICRTPLNSTSNDSITSKLNDNFFKIISQF